MEIGLEYVLNRHNEETKKEYKRMDHDNYFDIDEE